MPERRRAEELRGEIASERAELEAAVSALSSGARQTARTAGIAAAGTVGLLALVRLRPRRRAR
jgi:hypothetical protein